MACNVTTLPYVSSGPGGQFGDTITPTKLAEIAGTSGSLAVAASGRYVYFSISTTFYIYDIITPDSPVLLSSTTLANFPTTLVVWGKYVLAIGALSATFAVIDVSEPKVPVIASTIAVTFGYAVYFYGQYLLLSSLTIGVVLYDVGDLLNPVLISTTTGFSGAPGDATIIGTNLYFQSAGGSGYSIDLTNVYSLVIQDTVTTGSATALLAQGGVDKYVFSGADYTINETNLVDLSDPANISLTKLTLTEAVYAYSRVYGRLFMFGAPSGKIYGYDINDPTNPVQAFVIDTNSLAFAVAGDYVIAMQQAGANVLEVWQITGLSFVTLSAGSIEVGELDVRNDLRVQKLASFLGPSIFGQNAFFQSNLGVGGYLSARAGVEENIRTVTATRDTASKRDVVIHANASADADFYLPTADNALTDLGLGHRITYVKANNNQYCVGISAGGGAHTFVGFVYTGIVFTVTIPAAKNFTSANVNTGTEQINIAAHGFTTGQRCAFTSTGTIPGGIGSSNRYIIVVDANNIKVATSQANAWAGTAINITSTGSGTITCTPNATPYITATAHGFFDNTICQLTTTGGLPAGLSLLTNYWADAFDANTLRLGTTSTATTYVDITSAGSGTNTITPTTLNGLYSSTQNYTTGQKVQLTTTGTLPSPLALATTYYVIQGTTTGYFDLATTQANALAGTKITITAAGSPTNYIQARERINDTLPPVPPTTGLGAINLTQPYASVTIRRISDENWITE